MGFGNAVEENSKTFITVSGDFSSLCEQVCRDADTAGRGSSRRSWESALSTSGYLLWKNAAFSQQTFFLQADIDSPSRDVRQLNNTYKHHLKIKKPTRLTNHPDRDCFKDPRSHSLTWLDRIYDSKSGLVALPRTPAFNTMLWPGAGAKTPWTVLLSDELCFLY